MSFHYRSRPSPALLGLFLQNQDIGIDLQVIPGGWRLTGLGARNGHVSVNVTRDPTTAEPRCSCRAKRHPCRHVRALEAVGLLGVPAALTPRS